MAKEFIEPINDDLLDDPLLDEDLEEERVTSKKKEGLQDIIKGFAQFFLKSLLSLGLLIIFVFLLYMTAKITISVITEKRKADYYSKDIFDISKVKEKQKEITFPVGKISASLLEPEYIVNFELSVGVAKEGDEAVVGKVQSQIEEKKSKLISLIKNIISRKSIKEVNTREKVNYIIKKEILNEINSNLDNLKVRHVFISDFFPLKSPKPQKP